MSRLFIAHKGTKITKGTTINNVKNQHTIFFVTVVSLRETKERQATHVVHA